MADDHRSLGRRRLISMGVSYAMGTFNDNFFKQGALLLAASAGLFGIQGLATLLFALPFVLFSAWAGWLADRLPKRSIIVWGKVLELAAMIMAVWSLYTMSWNGAVFVVFLMGLQSTFFNLAVNGAIPENFEADDVPRVNAWLKTATTATILLGIACAGPALDLDLPSFMHAVLPEGDYAPGRMVVGFFAVAVALIGLAAALCVRARASGARILTPFPWLGPLDSVRHALECWHTDRELFWALAGEAFFYLLSSFAMLCTTNFGKVQLGLSMTMASLFTVALMVGVCAGAMLAGRWPVAQWRRYAPASGIGMSLGLLAAAFGPLLPGAIQLPYLFVCFTLAGISGGLYLIPLVSCIQVRPAAHEKGKTLGISNFASLSGVMLAGPLFGLLMAPQEQWGGGQGLTPAMLLGGSGLAGVAFSVGLGRALSRLPGTLDALPPGAVGILLRAVLSLRYRVTARGLERIQFDRGAGKPIVFLPNHPALVDPLLVYALLAGVRPRPLADESRLSGLLGRLVSALVRMVIIPDLSQRSGGDIKKAVEDGIARLSTALHGGDSVLLYPAGRIYRSQREVLGGNSGVARILRAVPEARIVLVRTTGLWGSRFSYAGAGGTSPALVGSLIKGAMILLANGLFFAPRREVDIELVEVTDLPRDDKKALNARLEAFYNATLRPATGVPRFFWQGSAPFTLPEPAATEYSTVREAIDPATREQIYAFLRATAGIDAAQPLREDMLLSAELGLDSLGMMTVVFWLETTFSVSVGAPANLGTVGDCLLAAAGLLNGADNEARRVPQAWFARTRAEGLAQGGQGASVVEAFLHLLREEPGAIVLGDRNGTRSRRGLLTAALILARRMRAYPDRRIGLLLPAVPAAPVVWLAAMLAGKEPVLLNWTVGEANLRHCIELAEVRRVFTSDALLERLESQGQALFGVVLPVDWVRLEPLAAGLSLFEKLRGALLARLPFRHTLAAVPETAAIVFTSGSETRPKAVPLSHANVLTNARDLIAVLNLRPDDSIMAMLPPFHSFGLLVDMVIPLAFGLRAAFHPNPTESVKVAALIRDFKLTLLPATPTFLDALLLRAKGGDSLESLRYAFVGAEKCPDHVYRAFAGQCPQAALCEGYGITECSPVVAVNRPGSVLPGSIGRALPSVLTAIVCEEDGRIIGPAADNEAGMLLVRGPSIFSGYLGSAPSPFVAYAGHTWYRTGDLVSQDNEGRLTFKGRLKRFVKKGGEMISLPQIESLLLEAFSSRPDAPQEGAPLAVEAGPEENGADIVLFTPMDITAVEANAALRQAGLSALHSVKRVVSMPVPLLGTGKTDYRSLKDRLAAKEEVFAVV